MPDFEIVTPEAQIALSRMFTRMKTQVDEAAEAASRAALRPLVTNNGTQIHPHAGGDKNYEFDQASPATTWTVVHNFGKFPSVTILDTSGVQIVGLVTHTNANSLTIEFNQAKDGKAILN